MGTVIIDQRGTQLQYDHGAMTVRAPEQAPRHVPLRLMDRLVITAAIQLDSNLLTYLAENNIGVVVMPGRGARRSAVLYGHTHGNTARRLAQYQAVSDPQRSLPWARRFVILRICGGLRLLHHALQLRPDLRHPLTQGITHLQSARTQARAANKLNTLRGIEGAAAAAYFSAYQSLFAESLQFHDRNRRPPRDPVNAVLSLGYTLVHADAIRAIITAGLDPMLGFLHEPTYNRESLACDFVELARPHVERVVWRLFAEGVLDADAFSDDNGACRLHKAGRERFYIAFESRAAIHRRAFRGAARVLARALAGQLNLPGIETD